MEQEKKNQNGAQELSVGDQIKVRREKLANLQAEGRNPFEITKFVQTTNSREIRENFDAMEGKPVSIAGRMMSKPSTRLRSTACSFSPGIKPASSVGSKMKSPTDSAMPSTTER